MKKNSEILGNASTNVKASTSVIRNTSFDSSLKTTPEAKIIAKRNQIRSKTIVMGSTLKNS